MKMRNQFQENNVQSNTWNNVFEQSQSELLLLKIKSAVDSKLVNQKTRELEEKNKEIESLKKEIDRVNAYATKIKENYESDVTDGRTRVSKYVKIEELTKLVESQNREIDLLKQMQSHPSYRILKQVHEYYAQQSIDLNNVVEVNERLKKENEQLKAELKMQDAVSPIKSEELNDACSQINEALSMLINVEQRLIRTRA